MITPIHFTVWLILLMAWELVWKGIALYKSGKHEQITWFVVMFIINTAGLLPIIYLAFFQHASWMKKTKSNKKKRAKKK